MSREDAADNRSKDNSTPRPNGPPEFYARRQEDDDPKIWAILLFGLIGATVTTAAVTHLRRTADKIYSEFTRSTSSGKSSAGRSSHPRFQEAAWRRYRERLQEEAEEEMERVERIRRMQSVFNRERNKYKQSYESWSGNGPGAYHQHFQRNCEYLLTRRRICYTCLNSPYLAVIEYVMLFRICQAMILGIGIMSRGQCSWSVYVVL